MDCRPIPIRMISGRHRAMQCLNKRDREGYIKNVEIEVEVQSSKRSRAEAISFLALIRGGKRDSLVLRSSVYI